MDQALEVANLKTELIESSSSDRLQISPEVQLNLIKQQSNCLVESIHIKTEPQEIENKFQVIADSTYNSCPIYDMKIENDEPMVKIECENLIGGIMQDPLDVGDEIKDKRFPIDLVSESKVKTEPTEEEKYNKVLETDEEFDSQWREDENQVLIRIDQVSKDKKYVCNECNKTFTQNSSLKTHLRIHTGEKPFTCDICKTFFTQKSSLDTHMLIHSGEKPYTCNICREVFSRKSNLNRHKLIHSDIKLFSCNHCNKSFTQKQQLVAHERIHTGDKQFSCNMCNKAFIQKSDLTKHARTHTGEKPYSCNVCNKSFTQKSNLNQHKRTHKN